MRLSKLLDLVRHVNDYDDDVDPEIEFVGIKWQEEHHPSVELFPIEFVNAKGNEKKVTLKFITTKHHP